MAWILIVPFSIALLLAIYYRARYLKSEALRARYVALFKSSQDFAWEQSVYIKELEDILDVPEPSSEGMNRAELFDLTQEMYWMFVPGWDVRHD